MKQYKSLEVEETKIQDLHKKSGIEQVMEKNLTMELLFLLWSSY